MWQITAKKRFARALAAVSDHVGLIGTSQFATSTPI